jgi:hypothetical protein
MSTDEGIIYHPSRYVPAVGHAGFDVYLRPQPSVRYFDACRVSLPVEAAGVVKRQRMEAATTPGPELRFAAGRIRIDAHDGDCEEVFGFGGVATLSVESGTTICRVTSSAPFLPLGNDPNSAVALLEAEFEVILARRRAEWGAGEYAHLDRLGHVEPLTLFVASLAAMEQRLAALARAGDEDDTLRHGLRLARQMRETLARAGDWPAVPPELGELL